MAKREIYFSTRNRLAVLALFFLMPLMGWGQITATTDANGNGTIEDSEKYLYLIQTQQFESFYITPKDNVDLNTVNLPHSGMLWYFLEAEYDEVNHIQYYYIVNNNTGEYVYNTNYTLDNNNGRLIKLGTFDSSDNTKGFKFYLIEDGTTGYYYIYIKQNGRQWLGLNKQQGNVAHTNGIRLTNSQFIDNINSRWKFIPYNGTLVWPNPPFTVSTDSEKHYYKIRNKRANTYYISTNPSTSKVTYSSTVSNDMAWYFKEAPSSGLMKYYYIINPAAEDKYMYFDGNTNTSDQYNAVSIKDINDPNADADRFLFVIVQAAIANGDVPVNGYYMIVPKLLIGNLWSSNSLGPRSQTNGSNMGIIAGRGDNLYSHWSFVLMDEYPMSCSTPTITYSTATGKITITSTPADADIYYTTNGTVPSASAGTHYSGPFAVSSPVTINAIATKTGYGNSPVKTVSFDQVARPTIQNNGSNAISITSTTEGATIYYTTDGTLPTTASTLYTGPLTENVSGVTIKAIAVKEEWINSNVETGSVTLKCAKPVFTRSGDYITISCIFPPSGVTIYYTVNGAPPTTSSSVYSTPIQVSIGDVIRAIASAAGYDTSDVATKTIFEELTPDSEGKYHITNQTDFEIFVDMANSEDGAQHHYVLEANVAAVSEIAEPFTGIFDGNYHTVTGLFAPFFNTVDGGTVKNVMLDNVSISGGTNVGAICGEATGASRIYNCGVLGGSIGGGTNVGGLVGLIEAGSSVRVVNCYNFADVTGGGTDTYAAGIVGKNEGTVGAVRIALCMMYGNVTTATNRSPVYCGNHVSNSKNFTEYNYWRYRSRMQYTAYNDQMAIDKDDYLSRFPFYRHILNTHRELAAYFLFAANTTQGSVVGISQDDIDEIGHWALKKDIAPYPIIERWETNTRKVLDANATNIVNDEHLPSSLSVTVKIGTEGMASGSTAIQTTISLPVTDMDEDNYDFTYGKVVLPFANEFRNSSNEPWTPNYGKICTGWKITGITGGTAGTFEHYNVSDRNCTAKDLYSTTGFIFAQGGNFIVPYGVTAIEITANFANAFYLCDESYEIAYEKDGVTVPPNTAGNAPSGYMTRTTLAGSTPDTYHDKTVYHTLAAALGAMSASGTTHAQAIVLVGNYHLDDFDLENLGLLGKGYTFMSIDADNNQEPDYAIYSNNTMDRPAIPPTRYDFVAFIPIGMSSHVNGAFFYPNTPIWKPRGWFEITETGLMWANQFEIDSGNFNSSTDERNYRCIINGGYFTQMVRSRRVACTKLKYYQIGGKAYVKEFYPGNHSQNNYANTIVPVNVTGGEIEQCFMTGYGKGTVYGPCIYFWCAGGKIGKFLGSYMEKPRQTNNSDGNVDLTAKIDHAIIGRFFGGGTTEKAKITGNIDVTINNSKVDFYCGGPEFGNMVGGKTVTTHAFNTTFGEYYGAGFGGTAITYRNDKDDSSVALAATVNYPDHFTTYYVDNTNHKGRLYYLADYGIGSCYKFEFIMHSRGNYGVARFYTGFASFSLATTGNVVNELDSCTILNSFYGAGCQGMVNGTVTSTLTDCTVQGSAFGGGYKAAANEVEVYPTAKPLPYSTFTAETGIFSDFGTQEPEKYTWQQGTTTGQHDSADETNQKLYTGTDVTLTDLGNVTGDIKITLNGNTTVRGSVFGGGNESKSLSNTLVEILEHTKVLGNIYGGGNMGEVEGNTKVIVNGRSSGSNTSTDPSSGPTGD